MAQPLPEFTGVFSREKWRPSADEISSGNNFVIGELQDGTSIKGHARPGELIPGLTYRFFGKLETGGKFGNGKTISFQAYTKSEPHSRFGLVNYLAKYAPGVGPAIAGKLFEAFGSDACRILREDPARAAESVPRLTLERAREASAALAAIANMEDTKIELTNLFSGRGFPSAMLDQVIAKLGPLAPERIKRDPFCLLVYGFTGAGFARVDRLYSDLGLPLDSTKRILICAWHSIREDREGHTWFPIFALKDIAKRNIGSVELDRRYSSSTNDSLWVRAMKVGRRAGWLVVRKDSDGRFWVADGEKARNEKQIAVKVVELLREPVILPRFTEAIEGECDGTTDEQADRLVEEILEEARGLSGLSVGDEASDPPATPEELAEIGRKTGICQFCGRSLTHPRSKLLGYGPVCGPRNGLVWDEAVDSQCEIQEENEIELESNTTTFAGANP